MLRGKGGAVLVGNLDFNQSGTKLSLISQFSFTPRGRNGESSLHWSNVAQTPSSVPDNRGRQLLADIATDVLVLERNALALRG